MMDLDDLNAILQYLTTKWEYFELACEDGHWMCRNHTDEGLPVGIEKRSYDADTWLGALSEAFIVETHLEMSGKT